MANDSWSKFYKIPHNFLTDARLGKMEQRKSRFQTLGDDPQFWSCMMTYFALVQSPENNQAGLFRFSPERLAADCRMKLETVEANLNFLQDADLIRWDEKCMLVLICEPTWNNDWNDPNKVKGIVKAVEPFAGHSFATARTRSVSEKVDILDVLKLSPTATQAQAMSYPSLSDELPKPKPTATQAQALDIDKDIDEMRSDEDIDLDFKTVPQIEWPPDEYDAPSEHTPNEPSEIKAKEEQKPKRNSRKDQKAKAEAYAAAVTAYWEANQDELKGYAPNRDYENFIPQVEGWCYAKPANAAKKSLKETHLKAFIKNWLQGMPEIKPSYLPQNREKWAHHAMALHRSVKEAWEAKADELRKRYPQRAYGVVVGALEAWILNNHEKCMRHEATEEGAVRLIESFLSRANVIPEWGIGDESAEVAELEDRYRYAELAKYKVNRDEADRDLDTIAYGDSLGGIEFLTGTDYDEYQAASRRVRLAKEYCAKFNRPLPFTREGISGNAEWDSEEMREERRRHSKLLSECMGPDQKAMPGVLTREQQEAIG